MTSTATQAKSTKCLFIVSIDGRTIARFELVGDAQFFAEAADNAGLFAITNPGSRPVVYDAKGYQHPYGSEILSS